MNIGSLKIFALALCSCYGLVIGVSNDCNCPGPIKYYEEIGCKPEFQKEGDCCPVRYNCEHLEHLPSDKCVFNGHTYEIGDTLREEDANPCDIGCFCAKGQGGASFTCAVVDCFFGPVQPGCYMKQNATSCCAGPVVCPEKEEDRPTCIVDGKTYRDGDYFTPAAEPDKSCYCGAGYTGENVEPFCVKHKHECGVMLRHADVIRDNCIPTYYYEQSPRTDCSVAYRCQNKNDTVITKPENASRAKSAGESGMTCKFGNLEMQIGDELSQATDYSSVCMKCVCEVPPVPTCQRLPDSECDVTKHPDFNRR